MIFFIIVVMGLIAKIAGYNIFKLLKYLKDEILLGYSTASSETVLPKIMEKMENLGCPKAMDLPLLRVLTVSLIWHVQL
jgi:proton glutamate symport protein